MSMYGAGVLVYMHIILIGSMLWYEYDNSPNISYEYVLSLRLTHIYEYDIALVPYAYHNTERICYGMSMIILQTYHMSIYGTGIFVWYAYISQ